MGIFWGLVSAGVGAFATIQPRRAIQKIGVAKVVSFGMFVGGHFDLLHDAALGDQRTLDAHGNRGSGFCRRIRDCRSILVLFEEHRIHSAGINFDSCFL